MLHIGCCISAGDDATGRTSLVDRLTIILDTGSDPTGRSVGKCSRHFDSVPRQYVGCCDAKLQGSVLRVEARGFLS